ncbi:SRPBCC domain-containing protein [Fluviicola sp.]|uniref:SRPBCC family protein n=1 Tax=Fluviicola sp. TaxID=1917219 RepID=UPI002639E2B9|nr:SRPBCC domain-containing protein [Fluviicola sp.]
MKNFNWTQFTKRIAVKSDMKTVYDAWTKSEELEKWFLSRAVYYSAENEKVSPSENCSAGCRYEWNWFTQGYYEEGKVTEANGTDFFEFTFAGNCKVGITLKPEKDSVLVELTQREIPLDDESKANIRLGCAFGWTFYLINLKSILEGGIDLRNKDTELAGVVNN